jgi:hypothetical protein
MPTHGQKSRHVDIAVVRRGQPYTGRYTVENGLVTVTAIGGTKTARLGGCNPKELAQLLLSEIVSEHVATMNPKQ